MKFRVGFVSNSSSCSFIVNNIKYNTVELVEEQIRKMIDFFELEESFDSMFGGITEVRKSDCTPNDRRANDYEDYDKLPMSAVGKIRIDSASDNSIPWDIMQCIESKLNAEHYHWG